MKNNPFTKRIILLLKKKKIEVTGIILLLCYFLQVVYIIQNTGMIADEQFYPGVGKYIVETGDFKQTTFALQYHPVLAYYINSLFLYFDQNPTWEQKPFNIPANATFYGLHNFLFLTRLPIALTGILLGVFIFKWARELYGNKAALLALALFSFEPTILANSGIAATDLVATTFILISLYFFWCLHKDYGRRNLVISGITLGLALLSKFTALLLIPITFILFLYLRKPFTKYFKDIFVFYLIAFFVVWAFYGFQVDTLMNTVHSEDKALEFINQKFTNEGIKSAVISSMNLPLPVPTYINAAIGYNIWHSSGGHISFLMGEVSEHGWWYFYIVAYLIKTPIPFLIIVSIFFIGLFQKKARIKRKDEMFLILPIVVVFIFLSFFVGFTIGLRHFMVVYPFSFIITSKIINFKFKKDNEKIYKIIIILLLVWYVIESVVVLPWSLSYFNEFIGGPKNGYLWLTSTNIDSGQGIIEIGKYQREHNIQEIKIATAVGEVYWEYYGNFTEAACTQENGVYAISAEFLNTLRRDCYAWLRERNPDAVLAGYSVFVYHVTDKNN